MKLGRLYILFGKFKDGVTTIPAKTIWIIGLPFLPTMIWVEPLVGTD